MADAARYNVARGARDHRHQHGLSGEEGLQRRRRLGAARERAARRARSSKRSCAPSTCPSRSRSAPDAIPTTATPSRSPTSPRPPAWRRSRCTAAPAPARSSGAVEYDTIRAVKAAVAIPVIANGDIDSPEQALGRCSPPPGADALMIGRAAQGRPWIFREILHYLAHGTALPPPTVAEAHAAIVAHLADHYAFYGEAPGVRIARKHIGWYTRDLAGGDAFRREINAVETAQRQLCAVDRFFDTTCPERPSTSTIARRPPPSSTRAPRSHGQQRRLGAGRPWPREKNTAHQRRERTWPLGREVARRILQEARRRAAARHLRHGHQARRARADRRR